MGSFQEKISAAILNRIRKRRPSPSPPNNNCDHSISRFPPAKLREATFSDFDAVMRLKKRCGLAADSIENWNRLWLDNPVLAAIAVRHPIGWVLEADQEIVGYLGNISLECRYGKKTLRAVTSHGFAVDPPYRAVALSLASAFYRQKSVDLFIASSAIESTGKMSLAFKCALLPQPGYDTVLFWVLRPYSFARVLLKKLAVRPIFASIACVFVALALTSDKVLRRRFPRRISDVLTVSEGGVESIRDDIEALWADKLQEGTRLYADRSPEVLRWHFQIPGDRGSVRVLRCYANRKLKGYAVVRTDKDCRDGTRRSVIADLIAKQDDPEVVRAIWVAAYEHAKAQGSDVLEVQGYPSNIRTVSSDWHPYRRKYPACPYNYRATDPELHKALSDPASWYACPYDGDGTLIRPSYQIAALGPAAQAMDRHQTSRAANLVEVQRTETI